MNYERIVNLDKKIGEIKEFIAVLEVGGFKCFSFWAFDYYSNDQVDFEIKAKFKTDYNGFKVERGTFGYYLLRTETLERAKKELENLKKKRKKLVTPWYKLIIK